MCNFTFANICLYYLNLSVHSWLIFGISSEQIWLPSYAAYILSKGKAKWWAVLIWNKCGYHVKVFKVLWLLCCNALLGTSALDSYDSPSYSYPRSIYLFKHEHSVYHSIWLTQPGQSFVYFMKLSFISLAWRNRI